MMNKPKVVITDFDYGDVSIETDILEKAGAEVITLQAKSEQDLFDVAQDCAAMINQYARVGFDTISRMEKCQVIARYGIGVDIVDVVAATKKGILVTNVQDYCTEEVADHAIALWLTLARKIIYYDKAVRNGVWSWQSGRPVHRLRGQTMGIVSFGKIGQAITNRAKAFGLDLIVYDPYIEPAVVKAAGAKLVSKAELVSKSDVIMMQVPMGADTRHFLSTEEFACMKPNTLIINTGRGPTVDNQALYTALSEGLIAGAGLDDPEEEPAKLANWSPENNPIFTLPNVIVTPHAAYYSEESIMTARATAASEVARVLTGEKPHYPVNSISRV
jgi:D-3-phosphoglycerate dehydrogenase